MKRMPSQISNASCRNTIDGGLYNEGRANASAFALRRLFLEELRHVAELVVALVEQVVGREAFDVVVMLEQRLVEQRGRSIVIRVRAVGRFGDDAIHASQVRQVFGGDLERFRGHVFLRWV